MGIQTTNDNRIRIPASMMEKAGFLPRQPLDIMETSNGVEIRRGRKMSKNALERNGILRRAVESDNRFRISLGTLRRQVGFKTRKSPRKWDVDIRKGSIRLKA